MWNLFTELARTVWGTALALSVMLLLTQERVKIKPNFWLPFTGAFILEVLLLFGKYTACALAVIYAINHPGAVVSIGMTFSALLVIVSNPRNFIPSLVLLLCAVANAPSL